MPEQRESITLSKLEYDRIRGLLDTTPSVWMNCLSLAVNAGLLLLAIHWLSMGSTVTYWAAQLLLPVVFFQGFGLLHDCGHGSFSSSRLGNTLVGHYASILCFLPYFPWKYVHTDHHVWTGNPDRDPGLAIVKRARDTGKLPVLITGAWRTWIPLGAFAQHVVYWSYPIIAARKGVLARGKILRCFTSVAVLGCAYTAMYLWAPNVFRLVNFAPAIALYLALVEFVNIPHHVGLTSFDERLPLWRQNLATRTCDYPPLISEFVVLNFNFHIEHHLFPNLPWYRLRQARKFVKASLGSAYRETHGLQWHTRARSRGFVAVLTASGSAEDAQASRTLDTLTNAPNKRSFVRSGNASS